MTYILVVILGHSLPEFMFVYYFTTNQNMYSPIAGEARGAALKTLMYWTSSSTSRNLSLVYINLILLVSSLYIIYFMQAPNIFCKMRKRKIGGALRVGIFR